MILKKGYSDINFVQIPDMKLFIFDIQEKKGEKMTLQLELAK